MKKDLPIAVAIACILAAAVGWYVRELTVEVRELRTELRSATTALTRVNTILEIQAGGNPYGEQP